MKVRLAPDGRSFTISNDGGTTGWSGSYAIEDLPQQLRFYRGLRDRRGGAFAPHYEETVAGLEAIAKEAAAST